MNKRNITPWSRFWLLVHRSMAKGEASQFIVFLIVLVLIWGTFILGCLVFQVPAAELSQSDYEANNIFSGTFYHLFTNGGQNLMSHKIGWLVTIISIILVATITSLLTNYFGKVAQRYLEGETHYRVENHVAIFGYHEMLHGLLKEIMENGDSQRFFLIQTNRVEEARKKLSQVLTSEQLNRVILQSGDLASPIGAHMHLKNADEIYILGEGTAQGKNLAHDDAVLHCLRSIVNELPSPKEGKKRILCHVMFEHHSTFAVFQRTDLNNKVFEKLAFLPFNYYETWARKVLVNDSLHPSVTQDSPYLPLEGTSGIGQDSMDHVHIIIVGMSKMGVSMGIMAAHLSHFPNFVCHPELKTRITFIDKNARNEMYRFQGRMEAMFQVSSWRFIQPDDDEYGFSKTSIDSAPWLNPLLDGDSVSPYKTKDKHLGQDFIDVEWEFIQGDVENPAIQNYIEHVARDKNVRLTVAVCDPDTNRSVEIGANLPPVVYEKAIQVLVYQPDGDAIIGALSTGSVSGFSPYSRVHAFGMSSDCYDLELIRKLVYVASYHKREDKKLSLRDMVDRDAYRKLEKASKSKAAAANLWSTIYNASHMWTKLRSIGSTDGSIPETLIDILGQTEHNRWTVEQLLTQFRPLLEEEQQSVIIGTESKDELKKTRFAHLDICSMSRLRVVDPKAVPYDNDKVEKIPIIYHQLYSSEQTSPNAS